MARLLKGSYGKPEVENYLAYSYRSWLAETGGIEDRAKITQFAIVSRKTMTFPQERIKMNLKSPVAVQGGLTGVFAAIAALSFYFVLDTVGLETGPLQPDVMILSLVMVIAISAAVFIYFSNFSFPLYTMTVFLVAPTTVFLREHYRHGPAGVNSPVTSAFVLFILVALLLGGGIGVSARRVTTQ